MSNVVQAGEAAPAFDLEAAPGEQVSLAQFKGRPVVLVFYPADWSPVCGSQVTLYTECLDMFEEHNAQVLGISVDGAWCHAAFAKDRKAGFPLLADFEPKGAVSKKYGVYREAEGVSERALVVIDGNGVVRWSFVSPIDVNPGADGILHALERMRAEG